VRDFLSEKFSFLPAFFDPPPRGHSSPAYGIGILVSTDLVVQGREEKIHEAAVSQ
jgi:hypothetical protein